MIIFSWIVLGFVVLLLIGSAVAWGLFLAMDDTRWQEQGVKVFRLAMVVLLFYVNVMIYWHIASVFRGAPPVVEIPVSAE